MGAAQGIDRSNLNVGQRQLLVRVFVLAQDRTLQYDRLPPMLKDKC